MKAGRIVLLVLGSILVLTSFGLLIGGGVVVAMENAFRDQSGYYSTNKIELSADSAAIVTGPAEIYMDNIWIRPQNLATLKIEARNVDTDKEVFIGVARTSKINTYLDGIRYSETRDLEPYHDSIEFHTYRGLDEAPPPSTQDFWVVSASGRGNQTMEWEMDNGRYSLVLMNADGSSPIDAEVSLGIKVPPVVQAVGTGLLVSGVILLLGGGVMLFFGIRGW